MNVNSELENKTYSCLHGMCIESFDFQIMYWKLALKVVRILNPMMADRVIVQAALNSMDYTDIEI